MLYRNPHNIFWTIVLPVLILVLFGLANLTGPAAIPIGVSGTAHQNSPLMGFLAHSPGVQLRRGSLATELRALGRGDVAVVVDMASTVPKVYYDRGRQVLAAEGIALVRQGLDGNSRSIDLTLVGRPSLNLTFIDFLLPGVIALAVMQGTMFTVLYSFVHLKRRGVLRRLMATPMSVTDFLLAQGAARLVLAGAQAAALTLVGIAFHAQVRGDILSLLLVAMLGGAVFVALGYALAGLVGNVETAAPFANAVGLPMILLSGVFFSRDLLPGWLAWLTQFLPLTYLVDALRQISEDGRPLWSVTGDLIGMAVWLLLCMFATTRYFRWAAD